MARSEVRPLVKLRSTGGTGYTYVTRKNRRNRPEPDGAAQVRPGAAAARRVPRGALMPRPDAGRPRRRKANPCARARSTPWTGRTPRCCARSSPTGARSAPAGVTGLTPRQQRQVATAIRNAREMALLPYPSAAKS